ncbi:indole-3-glycerol phosphate synthase TrpC [Bacillus sp. AK031]
MTDILKRIIERKGQEVAVLKEQGFERVHLHKKSCSSLFHRLHSSANIGVIAEIKRASPSKGDIVSTVNPVEQAKVYQDGGASAISVLTDTDFFKGSVQDLQQVRKAVDIPVLCKDFFIDEIQIDRAKDAGANIILLIAAVLPQQRLKELYEYCLLQDLEVLLEIHNEEDAQRAVSLDVPIIGINNRNLKTFKTSLGHTESLAPLFNNKKRVIISESGINSSEDAIRAARAGADGVLVGESLMRSGNAGAAIKSLKVNKEGALLG